MSKRLNIGIVGYGKMGKMVESLALERGHSIAFKNSSPDEQWLDCDVIIEFSRPEAVEANIKKALEKHIPIVTGTTGWKDRLAPMRSLVEEHNGSLLHASNFSIGVNIVFDINRRLAELLKPHDDYKAHMEESHHTEKLDSPSGTAISLAEDIIASHGNYDHWINNESANQASLPILSKREPEVPGTHIITWENDIDKISLKHEAKNRRGFALGALLAAEWLQGKQGVYTMADVINA